MIALRTRSGQTIRVSEERVAHWEARGYVRVDQSAKAEAPAKKTAAKKAPAKRSSSKK